MSDTPRRALDAEALALFARKGHEGGPDVPQAGEANAVKVRRILQLVRDLAGVPLDALRILDLGCGEGVYAIEAALHGARVVALDARRERMDQGAACAARHGLTSVEFVQGDVRAVTPETYGEFDVVLLLGLLYHLDETDALAVLDTVAGLCTRLLLVDTLVTRDPDRAVTWRRRSYRGVRVREHEDGDPPELRRSRLLRSIDNAFGFRFEPASLIRALHEAGFTSVLEAHVPLEPGKPADRVTLAALRGPRVRLGTYPWVNDAAEDALAERLGGAPPDTSSG